MLATLRVPLAVAAISFIAPYAAEAQRGGPIQLPDGPGKEVVQKRCVTCHPLNQITGAAGYDQAGWKYVIDSMVVLPADQMAAATQYLATHFPEKPGRASDAHPWTRRGDLQRMDGADARTAVTRSAADGRRHHLVDRAISAALSDASIPRPAR